MGAATGLSLSALMGMLSCGVHHELAAARGWYRAPIRLLLKGGTTLIAALLALYAALHSGGAAWGLFLGLLICALADVVLELHFQGGMLVFALGHVAYIAAFFSLGRPGLVNAAVFAALLLLIWALGPRLGRSIRQPLLPILLYASLLSLMLSLAVTQSLPAALGALLFLLSDGVIFHRLAYGGSRRGDMLCHLLYFSGQYLLAVSALLL